MARALDRWVREAYRRERIPAALRWALAAEGMSGWYAMLRRGLDGPLGGRGRAEAAIAAAARAAYERRFALLRERRALPERALGPVMGALSLSARHPKTRFVFRELPGAPASAAEHVAAERWLLGVGFEERWREVTTHLGEVLIALGVELPRRGLPQANAVLGRLCFDGGARYAELWKRRFGLPDGPESAIEVLRSSEYVFRVNPTHWHGPTAAEGAAYLEGTACPWFDRPGWSMQHCGVFGQFQSGIGSVFGLRYQLTKTIPKHGGATCRIDLVPLGRKPASATAHVPPGAR